MNFDEYCINNLNYVEDLNELYFNNPSVIDKSWKYFFDGFYLSQDNSYEIPDKQFLENIHEEFKVLRLIDDYRKRGHLFTETNPVRKRRKYSPTLDINNYDLSEHHLTKKYKAAKELGLPENTTLQEIINHLKQTYCRSIGVEFMYIRFPEIVSWFKEKMETIKNTPTFSIEQKKKIYKYLIEASFFEQFLHKKFVGQKRFSLEGIEAIIPALQYLAEYAINFEVEEITLGMAHRGRLTVLANFFEKPLNELFREYIGKNYDDDSVLGDVKYHLGYNSTKKIGNKELFMSLLPNPSHLETVGPVSLGFAKSRINNIHNGNYNKLLPIIIHGDAAISGQGIVYETAQMSLLEGYGVGGTIHFVLNNQVGFTTNYIEGRSSIYATDIGKITHSPIFHVNADDPEAIAYVVMLALEFRQKFHRDVYIDILGYRKHGHNEGDEPRFTQPTLYKAIEAHQPVRKIYFDKLTNEYQNIKDELIEIEKEYTNKLEKEFDVAKQNETVVVNHFLENKWKDFKHLSKKNAFDIVETSFSKERLKELAIQLKTLPSNKKFFSKAIKIIQEQISLINQEKVDWAISEHLAFATLLVEGHSVRLSGQDSERGTFNHRHAALVIEDTDEKYFPLKNLSESKAKFYIYNSLLSEYAVLAFEYGYSLASPNDLTIWEAQFGDFHNVGQVIIDQYISSAKDKWGMMSGLVLFLPHGYEGQGPEHSSARIERFLVLAANENMVIANVTTPANFFHLLRRQVKSKYRLPLILFTPKSTLRHPLNISTFDELAYGKFTEVIDDNEAKKETIKQIVLCSGKIYYELYEFRKKNQLNDTAIIRLEQLYPLHKELIYEIIKSYPNNQRIAWAQEEPANMGAWNFIRTNLTKLNLIGICRPPSGSTALGLYDLHKKQQEKIIEKAFKLCDCKNIDEYCYMKCTENS